MAYFNIVAQSSESTVVTEYKPQAKRSDAYQSEAELEREFIRLLGELGYEYLPIHKEKDLVDNLRLQLEAVNGYRFSDEEWGRLFWRGAGKPEKRYRGKDPAHSGGLCAGAPPGRRQQQKHYTV